MRHTRLGTPLMLQNYSFFPKTPNAAVNIYCRESHAIFALPLILFSITMKRLSIPVSELSAGGSVNKCINLCHSDAADLVASPTHTLRRNKALYPLAQCSLRSGITATLLADSLKPGQQLYRLYVDDADSLMEIGSVAAVPYCAVATGGGWTLMTASGPVSVELDSEDEWVVKMQAALNQPVILLRAVAAGSLEVNVGPLLLADTDTSRDSASLSDSGHSKLTAAFSEAYRSLATRAAHAGCWFQPLLGRVELFDAAGARLFTSEPQLIAPAGGWQCVDSVNVTAELDGSSLQIPSFTVSANAFKIEAIVISAGDYLQKGAGMSVSLSPQIHPVDFSARIEYRIVRASTKNPQLTVHFPGTTVAMGSRATERAALVKGLIARADAACAPAFTGLAPSDSSLLSDTWHADAAAEIATLVRLLATKPAVTASGSKSLMAEISSPNAFIARCVASSGNAVAWGDITPIRARPAIPWLPLTDNAEPPEWAGTLRATFADGSFTLSSVGYPMPFPSALPPLLSVAGAEVVQLDLWAENIESGEVSHASAQLRPDGSLSRSIYLNPSIEPVPLANIGPVDYPKAQPGQLWHGRRKCGAIVAADIESPVTPLGALSATAAPVVALHPAVKSQSSWDITRCHLYAFSPAGIFTVSLSADRSRIATTLIDPRGVNDGTLTAYTPAGVMALTNAGRLVAVSASKVSTLPFNVPSSCAIAWHPAAGSLWMLTEEATVRALDMSRGSLHDITFISRPLHIKSIGSSLIITADAGLLDADTVAPASRIISWQTRMFVVEGASPRFLSVAMAASSFEGTIKLRVDDGAGTNNSVKWLTLTLSGQINAPVLARLAPIRPAHYLTIAIDGHVSADFRLTSVTLR